MNLNSILSHVAVLGAAGKMGRGISLLWAQTLTQEYLKNRKSDDEPPTSKITLIDVSSSALSDLGEYLEANLEKWARRNKGEMAKLYKIPNDIPQDDYEKKVAEYVLDAKKPLRYASSIQGLEEASLVIEAATEDENLKRKILGDAEKLAKPDAYFFTNTSSIPIKELEKINDSKLKGRIMGLHYYNPPPVQKVVEIVNTTDTDENLVELAHMIGHMQKKTLLPANDVAGFIGNGHFMREGLYAINEAKKLEVHHDLEPHEAIYAVNKVYNDFLIRPMGMFQLIDYVGVDVFQLILLVMNNYLRESGEILYSTVIDDYRGRNIQGGQLKDGSQRDGILQYGEKGKITGVYSLTLNQYADTSKFEDKIDNLLGKTPKSHSPWGIFRKAPNREERIDLYLKELNDLKEEGQLGATLALKFLDNIRGIAQLLKDSGVVDNVEYVKTDLRDGFQHIIV